jgi:histidinol-phosphatase
VDLERLRAFALELADVADAISSAHFGGAVPAMAKPDGTPVTEADRAIEAALRARIGEAEPGHAVVGEEEGGVLEAAAPTWVIDPIDATKNFMRGVPVFATLIGLVTGGRAVIGVVSAPAMGERWDAAAGLGARRNGQRIGVSAVADLAEAHVCHGDADRFRELPALWDAFGRLHDDVWRMRGFGDFWNHLLVAAGAADAAFERELPAWDVAALVPILTEAGGRISDAHGGSVLDPAHARRPNLVVTSNGRVHDDLLARLAPALAAPAPD